MRWTRILRIHLTLLAGTNSIIISKSFNILYIRWECFSYNFFIIHFMEEFCYSYDRYVS